MIGKILKLTAVFGVLIFAYGCTHTLEVTNLESYRNMQMDSLRKPITVGIVPSATETDQQRLVKGIASGLGKHSANIILPYAPTGERKADVIANIQVRSDYSGSGWNFPINFPGFLIFFPAAHGYVYEAKYDFLIGLTSGTDNSKIDSWSIPVTLDVRHAGFNRTWTELGWLEIGIMPFLGGFVFMSYDDGVTVPLVDKIETPIGDFVAQDIVNRINAKYGFAPAPTAVQPVSPPAGKPVAKPEAGQTSS